MTRPVPAIWRVPLLIALVMVGFGPLALIVAASLAGEWFWPSLLPTSWDGRGWGYLAGAGGDRLASATVASLVLGSGTGTLAAALALPIGRAIAGLTGWRRAVGAAAAFLPVAAPPIAVAIGLQYSFLRLGVGGSLPGVLLAHLVPALGYDTLFFLGVFAVYDARLEEEARSLGASPRQVLARVTLPLLRRPLGEAFVLGFLVSWAQVPLTLLVGQGVVSTLAVEVLSFAQAGQDRLAAAGAVILLVPALGLLILARLAARRTDAVAV